MRATAVLPFAPRHVATDLGDSLRITLPSRKRWLTIIATALFAAVWTGIMLAAVVFAAIAIFSGMRNPPAATADSAFFVVFGFIWLSFMTVGGLTALYTLLWNLAGREVIDVNPLSIRLSHRVPGWGRSKEYSAEHIKDLRVSPQTMPEWYMRRSAWPAATTGQLAFDYGARTIRFADADEAEAKMILAEIQQRFPQYSGS